MNPEASRRLGHALQAITATERYTAKDCLHNCLADDLTRSVVQRQLGIVQEALRVALVEEPSLRQIWPDGDALLEGCARMRDWEQGVALADLVGFVDGDLKLWQGRLAEGLRLQQEEGAKLDAAITRNLAWLGFGAE
jgi:hypothetical protein